jgi:hypothetical protein
MKTLLAKEAMTARYRKWDDDAIAGFDGLHFRAGFLDHTHEFMSQNEVFQLREEAVVNVKIRAADGCGSDPQNYILGMLDFRIFNIVNFDVLGPMENECFHSLTAACASTS